MDKRLYLVTGGAGFIGSHICERLLASGHRVRILDNFSTGKEENLRFDAGEPELIDGDIRDVDTVREAVEGAEIVFHEAALGSVSRSVDDPVSTHDINITGTLNVLLAARDSGVRRVVYASSSSVYGDTAVLPKTEDIRPGPLSPYALSKLAAEHYCLVFHHVYGLQTVALRYFNIFGPRQDPQSDYAAVIPKFATAVIAGQSPVIYGDGRQSRDFTYVENVVEANLLASEAPEAAGKYFNVACGGRYDLLELLDGIKKIVGSNIEPLFEAARAGDVRNSQASIDAAKQYLGYNVVVDFEDGLRKTVNWYREKAEHG
jgi:nucleoside-diphosphate-sugar epimerase